MNSHVDPICTCCRRPQGTPHTPDCRYRGFTPEQSMNAHTQSLVIVGTTLMADCQPIPHYVVGCTDVRRLVACWNALEDMRTEDIEKVSLAMGTANSVLKDAIDVREERDRLRAELAAARADVEIMRKAMTGTAEKPETATDAILSSVKMLVSLAWLNGQVVTIAQRPLLPLAMGNYESVVSVRQARERAQ